MNTQNLQDYVKFLEQQVNDEGRTINQLKFFRTPTTSSTFQMPALPTISPLISPSGKNLKRATRAISPLQSRSSASIFESQSRLLGATLDNFAEHVEKRIDLIGCGRWFKRHADRPEAVSMSHGRQHMAGTYFPDEQAEPAESAIPPRSKAICTVSAFLLLKGKEGRVRQSADRFAIDHRIRGDRLQAGLQPVPYRRGPALAVQSCLSGICRSTETCDQRQSFRSRSMPLFS